MSAVAVAPDIDTAGRDQRPGLGRLTYVELRKMVDTRAGSWLLAIVGAIALLVTLLVAIFGKGADTEWRTMVTDNAFAVSFLMPVVGILLVTSEWSQRTTLGTFALVPSRGRVMAAKLLAALALTAIAFALCFVLGLVGSAIAGGAAEGSPSVPSAVIGQAAVYLLAAMLIGIGFGAACLSSPLAIVLYYVLPIGIELLGNIHALESTINWIGKSGALEPLTEMDGLSGTEWGRVGTSLAVWLLLPLAVGIWRILRDEIR